MVVGGCQASKVKCFGVDYFTLSNSGWCLAGTQSLTPNAFRQRILEKLARLATLAEVSMKAVTENELENLGL